MAEGVKQLLSRPIQLADQLARLAEESERSRLECAELRSRAENLAGLLRHAARSDLYERPTRRIVSDTSQTLEKALALACKCRSQRSSLLLRVLTLIPAAAFKKTCSALDNSVGDVAWLLRVSNSDDGVLGFPPIAANDPILGMIWENVAKIQRASAPEEKAEAASALLSFARDNPRNGKIIVEEGGVVPLLKLLKDGSVEGQENAARALALLGRDPESVEAMVRDGVCSVFAKMLREGGMRVQAEVAAAVAVFVEHYPNCQDVFAQSNVVRHLVGHLAFETVEEHSRYIIPPRNNPINIDDNASNSNGFQQTHMHSVVNSTLHHLSVKSRDQEDPTIKARMKVMAARALWQLLKGNSAICKTVTESRALLCFAVLLEKGPDEVKYNSAMALMEITRVAEKDADLRRSAFKPSSPAAKSVIDQLVNIVEKGEETSLLVPSIVALGCLSRTFRATESRLISPLVRFLDEKEPDITKEAVLALTKFACTDNYLHKNHSKAIIAEGGAKHLVQLVYFGEPGVKIPALVLLCYIAIHVPDSEELAGAKVRAVLEAASKQGTLVQGPEVENLLSDAKSKLELYQSRGSRGFY